MSDLNFSPLRRQAADRRRAQNLLCRDLRRGDSTRNPLPPAVGKSRESCRSRGRGVGFEHPRRVASGHGFGRTAKAQAESRSPDCAGPPRVAGARHAHLAPAAECDPAGAGRDRTCCGSGRRRTSPRAITRHRPGFGQGHDHPFPYRIRPAMSALQSKLAWMNPVH